MHAASPESVGLYFDHGATSFPKPAAVARTMARYLDEMGGTYGRAAYGQVQESSRLVFETRSKLGVFLGCADASRVVFTLNATHALNVAIQGLARPTGTVLVSPLEHNATMRPLHALASRAKIRLETLPFAEDGRVLPEAIRIPKDACLAVVAHQSNVNGVVQPIAEIKRALGDLPLIVDAAQSAGEIPISFDASKVEALALSGHKHLLGPTGIGALLVGEGVSLPPLMYGGTGSRSESFEQPEILPDAHESGTPNIVGIAGLGAALEFLDGHGMGDGVSLARLAKKEVAHIPGVRVLGASRDSHQGSLFSFLIDGISPSEVARRLWERHRIAVRAGLHCAPRAHETLGTWNGGGAVRVAFGRFHDENAVSRIVSAIADAARRP